MTIRTTSKASYKGIEYQYLFWCKQGNEFIHRASGGIIGLARPLNPTAQALRAALKDYFNDVIIIKRVAKNGNSLSYRLHDLSNTVQQKNFDTRLIGFLPKTAEIVVNAMEEIENMYFDNHTTDIK